MNKDPSDSPKVEPRQRGTSQGGCAGVILVVLTLAGTYLIAPGDTLSMSITACIIGTMLAGMYLLGVRDGRRE
jgi:hypothetical protein